MPYTRPYPGGFKDYPDTSTPLTAAVLNTMDQGIENSQKNFQISPTAPSSPSTGELWLDTTTLTLNYWNGGAWVGVFSESATNARNTSYSLVISDQNKIIEMSGGGTLTVPTEASVPFPLGCQVTILQTGTSQVTVSGAGGVTVNGRIGTKLAGQWSAATLLKRASNTWVLMGDTTA